MHSITINGSLLTYEVSGDGDPLILVHGFLARSTGDYYAALKELLSKSYRVFALDMRAHGGAGTASEGATLAQGARDIAAFVAALDLTDVLLVGHSMGGYLCMATAVLDPAPLKALALITPASGKGQPTPDAVIADFVLARGDRGVMGARFASMFVRPASQHELDTLVDAALCMPDAVAERWMREEWPNSDLTRDLASIELPVLSLIGAKDVVVPPQRQYEDALRLPNGKIITFTREGHMFPLERPLQCVNELTRFFGD